MLGKRREEMPIGRWMAVARVEAKSIWWEQVEWAGVQELDQGPGHKHGACTEVDEDQLFNKLIIHLNKRRLVMLYYKLGIIHTRFPV